MLYVVDSVTRRWVEQAKQQGQSVNSSAKDGTYAAGVHRVTELLPVLMNDIIQTAPGEQKVRYIILVARSIVVVLVLVLVIASTLSNTNRDAVGISQRYLVVLFPSIRPIFVMVPSRLLA